MKATLPRGKSLHSLIEEAKRRRSGGRWQQIRIIADPGNSSTTSVDADEMEVDEDAESRRLAAFALATMDGYYDILPQITDYEYVGRMYDGTKIKPCKRQKTGHDWDGWLSRSNPAPDWA